MSLRKKTFLIIGVTTISLVAILYIISKNILLDSFAKLEAQDTHKNVERALAALTDDLTKLQEVTRDWAAWDDTYAFINGDNDAYVNINIVDSAFTTLRLDLMAFVHSSGRIVYRKAFDMHQKKTIPFPEDVSKHLSGNSLLLRHSDATSSIRGIILFSENPVLIAASPILTSEEKGPVRGTLIFGRYLNKAEIKRLAENTYLSLAVHRLDDSEISHDLIKARELLSKGSQIHIEPLSEESITGYTLLNDIYGQPALILSVNMPRNIYQQGRTTVQYLLLSLLVVGLLFGTLTLLILEKYVLPKLALISQSIKNIGITGDLSTRVAMTGGDELSHLAEEINEMLQKLERTEKTLMAFSHHDELTGLYNRRGFFPLSEQQVKLSNRTKKGILLIFADLDDLKKINDEFGHIEGDQALIDTAAILKSTFRDSEIIARIGGDEFVILAINTDNNAAGKIHLQLKENIDSFNKKGVRNYKLTLSIGIANYDPGNPCSIDELLARADALMYKQKKVK